MLARASYYRLVGFLLLWLFFGFGDVSGAAVFRNDELVLMAVVVIERDV